jgi:predicted nucleotidyltransferase
VTLPSNVEPDWPKVFRRIARAQAEREKAVRDRHARRCRDLALQLALRLGAEPGVRRVVLFGSLAGPGGAVHERSDIDLAVEGLPAARMPEVCDVVESLAAGIHVDLVRIEDAAPPLRETIERWGEPLHVAR